MNKQELRRAIVIAMGVGAALLLEPQTSQASEVCAGQISTLYTRAAGVTLVVDGCSTACSDTFDIYPANVGLNRMLAHLLTLQARGETVFVSYDNPGSVPGRCELVQVSGQ